MNADPDPYPHNWKMCKAAYLSYRPRNTVTPLTEKWEGQASSSFAPMNVILILLWLKADKLTNEEMKRRLFR